MTTDDPERREEAARWLARLHSRSVTTGELTDFAKWRRDPANADAYRAAEQFWEASGELADDLDIVDALSEARKRRRLARWWDRPLNRWLSIGTAVAIVSIVFAAIIAPSAGPIYKTAIGERSVARLDDGSTMQLDTDTVVTTQIGKDERRIKLDRGQAFFAVRHDVSRPFVVEADGVTITALGTRFDVDHDRGQVTVSLIEGSVAVRALATAKAIILKPGETVTITEGMIGRVLRDRAADLTSWRDGRLSFRKTPLNEAIDAMNRYTDRPVIIRSSPIAREPISGDFATDDIDGFVSAVGALFGSDTVTRRPDQ